MARGKITTIEFRIGIHTEDRQNYHVAKTDPPIITAYGNDEDSVIQRIESGIDTLLDSIESVSGASGVQRYLERHGIEYTMTTSERNESPRPPVPSIPIKRKLAYA